MLHVLHSTSKDLLLEFNASKLFCTAFGSGGSSPPQLLQNEMCLGAALFTYLGVVFTAGATGCMPLSSFLCETLLHS